MPNKRRLSDAEVLAHLRDNTPVNQVRLALSSAIGEAENSVAQRFPPTSVEIRRMEFESLERILKVAEEAGLVQILDLEGAMEAPARQELAPEH